MNFKFQEERQDVNTSGMPNYANFGCSIIEYIFKLAYLKVFIFSKAQYLKSIDLFFFNKFAYPKEFVFLLFGKRMGLN